LTHILIINQHSHPRRSGEKKCFFVTNMLVTKTVFVTSISVKIIGTTLVDELGLPIRPIYYRRSSFYVRVSHFVFKHCTGNNYCLVQALKRSLNSHLKSAN